MENTNWETELETSGDTFYLVTLGNITLYGMKNSNFVFKLKCVLILIFCFCWADYLIIPYRMD